MRHVSASGLRWLPAMSALSCGAAPPGMTGQPPPLLCFPAAPIVQFADPTRRAPPRTGAVKSATEVAEPDLVSEDRCDDGTTFNLAHDHIPGAYPACRSLPVL